jgi:DNA-binding winged helix-turn-helix (wHTH) protein
MAAYRFGEFLLDPATRMLWRGDAPVSLAPKAFDCIVYLVERRDRAVGRDELIAAVWGKVDISDNALGQVVLHARRALDDTASEKYAIRTVPRFGYRWEARTEVVDAPPPAPAGGPASTQAAAQDARPREPLPQRRRYTLALLIVGSVLLASWIALRWMPLVAPGANGPGPGETLALVLPVEVNADESFAWVRLGIMDLIAERLRAAGQAVVPSDNVVGLLRDADTDPDAAGQVADLARLADAGLVLQAHADLVEGHWTVLLRTVYGHDPPIEVQAGSPDVIDAARAAADQLAQRLGLGATRTGDASTDGRALSILLQQVRAALLTGQLDAAEALLAHATPAQRAHPEVRVQLAEIDFRAGRLDAAQTALETLLGEVSAADAPVLRARILNAMANVSYQRGDFTATERNSDRAIRLLADRDAPKELGRAYIGRASGHSAQHEYPAAMQDFAQARVVLAGAGDRLALARADAYLGLLDESRARHTQALAVLPGAADRLATFHALIEELHARVGIAFAQLALLRHAEALEGETRLRELAERVADPRRRNYANLARVRILAVNGRLRDADTLLAGIAADAAGNPDSLLAQSRVELHGIGARLALERGDAKTAAREAEAALALPRSSNTASQFALASLTLVRARLLLDQDAAAEAAANAAADWGAHSDAPDAKVYCALAVAEYAASRGANDEARAAFEDALAQADVSRSPDDLLAVAESYAGYLLRHGDLEHAGSVVGRIANLGSRVFRAALLQVRLYHAIGETRAWRDALEHARDLAGERVIPAALQIAPVGG